MPSEMLESIIRMKARSISMETRSRIWRPARPGKGGRGLGGYRSDTGAAGRSAHLLDALLPRHSLPRALSGAGVGPGPLAADREALAMPQPAVAADVAEARDVLLDLPAELPLHRVLVIQERSQLGQVVFGEVAGPLVGIDPRPLAQLFGQVRPDPVDVA